MEWPAYSKDLNPIISLWDAVRDVCKRLSPPATLRGLTNINGNSGWYTGEKTITGLCDG